MKILVVQEGEQNWQWDLPTGGTVEVATVVRPIDVPQDTPDIGMPVVYALQTDLTITGQHGTYTVFGVYGPMNGEKIEGEFKDGITNILNLQPGEYEIVIYSRSHNILAGEPPSLVGIR